MSVVSENGNYIMQIILLSIAFIASLFVSVDVYASGGEKKESVFGGVEYVKMSPLILPIIDDDGVFQTLSMVVTIEVDNQISADKVREKSPKLKDAYIQDMYGVLNEYGALKGGIIQVHIIKDRLNMITKKVLGDDIEAEVLLEVVQQRQI